MPPKFANAATVFENLGNSSRKTPPVFENLGNKSRSNSNRANESGRSKATAKARPHEQIINDNVGLKRGSYGTYNPSYKDDSSDSESFYEPDENDELAPSDSEDSAYLDGERGGAKRSRGRPKKGVVNNNTQEKVMSKKTSRKIRRKIMKMHAAVLRKDGSRIAAARRLW